MILEYQVYAEEDDVLAPSSVCSLSCSQKKEPELGLMISQGTIFRLLLLLSSGARMHFACALTDSKLLPLT
jgi:hypothetical protein